MTRIWFACAALSIFVLTLSLGFAFAQTEGATMSGVISDPHGAVVPDVEVVATRIETGTAFRTTTNRAGIYVFASLRPGHYHLEVRRPGFKAIAVKEIELNVQDKLERNFSLEIGSVSESITVEANGLTLNTTDAAVSTVIDRNFVENLPLNGRSFNTLLQLTPGVVIGQTNATLGQFSISGQRTDANNFTVDGVSANFGVAGGDGLQNSGTGAVQAFSALGGTSSLVSVDALQEFRIETSSFAPEFGKTPGGQVILTTRSGTNDFHGTAFDYFRNTVMDANNWFNDNATPTIPKAPEHHNDFGGVFGGPIQKDKTFFFFSYEGARLDQPQTLFINVPSEYARTSAPAGLAPFMKAYPQPDDRTVTAGVFVAPFTGSFANRATLDAASLRIDHTFGDRFTMFARYNYAPSELIAPSFSLSTLQTTQVNTQTLTVGLNMALSSRLSNTLRGNYSSQSNNTNESLDSFGGAVPLNPSLLLGSLPTAQNSALFDDFDFSSPVVFGSGGKNKTRQVDFTDDLALSVGTHQLQFGGDFRAIFLNAGPAQYQLQYLVFATPSFLSGPSAGSTFLGDSVFLPTQFLSRSVSLYAQDRWKVTPRLNVTYGLRWELSPAPTPRGTTALSAWQNVNNAQLSLAPPGTPIWTTKYGNFAPRLGVAYSLTPKGDFILRAGGGIFYDLGIGSSANLAYSFPNSTGGFNPSATVPVTDINSTFLGIVPQPPYLAVKGFSPNLKLPRSYQWNVALEKSFGDRQAISATYVGQAGRDLLRQEALYQPNADFLGTDFILTYNGARSNYNALQLQYRRPLSSRLQALLNYTWSHSLDNLSDDTVIALASNVVSGAGDYASSDSDVRQSFSGAISYDIPAAAKSGAIAMLTGHWSLQSVVMARSGFPFNAFLRSTSPDPGGSAVSRPDLVLGQPFWIATPGAPGGKILNRAAFSIPSTPRQGTEPRNDIPGLGLTQVDLSIARTFPITERLKLQFRADAFNALNHPNFANPGAFVILGAPFQGVFEMANQGLGGLNPLFQQGGPRSLQLSLKVTF
jgi:hypothetical protein